MYAEDMDGFEEYKKAWEERMNEPLGGRLLSGIELEEHNRKHPDRLSEDEVLELLKAYQEG